MKALILAIFILFVHQTLHAQTVIVNPNGTHSVGVNHGSHTVVVNRDGTHSIGVNHGAHTVVVNPDGTHSVGVNHGHHAIHLQHHKNAIKFSDFMTNTLDDDIDCFETDSLFLRESTTLHDEYFKLKVLRRFGVINRKEYKYLKKKNELTATYFQKNTANQLFELGSDYYLGDISRYYFKQKKRELIVDN